METLLQGVNKARATLEAVGAEAELFNDISVAAQLVSKLSVCIRIGGIKTRPPMTSVTTRGNQG